MQIRTATPDYYPFLEHLYLEAFPIEERRPFSYLLSCTKQKRSQMFYLYDEIKDCAVGLAFTLEHNDVVLLDYFAIAPEFRGQGYGALALFKLRALFSEQCFFLEIELPDPSAKNNQQRLRRKAFYLRCGMKESGLNVSLFTVPMELLLSNPNHTITFSRYHELYVHAIGQKLSENVLPLKN